MGYDSSVIDLEIETQDTTPAPVDDNSIMGKLRRAADRAGIFDEDSEPEKIETRGRKKKTAQADEFNTLVIALLSLVLSFTNIPENIKPIDSELNQFSHHLTGLLIRHLPISGKFSADALDIIGLLAVGSGWYARVAPELKAARQPKQEAQEPQYHFQTTEPAPAPVDDITRINPGVGGWLNQKATQGGAA